MSDSLIFRWLFMMTVPLSLFGLLRRISGFQEPFDSITFEMACSPRLISGRIPSASIDEMFLENSVIEDAYWGSRQSTAISAQ